MSTPAVSPFRLLRPSVFHWSSSPRLRLPCPICQSFNSLQKRSSSVSQRPDSDRYILCPQFNLVLSRAFAYKGGNSVHFPGAVNSKFTSKMDFIRPSTLAAIPTYRVMDSHGRVLDPERAPKEDVDQEEILTWYRNMVSGKQSPIEITSLSILPNATLILPQDAKIRG